VKAEDKGVGDKGETNGWLVSDNNGSLVLQTPTKENFYITFNL